MELFFGFILLLMLLLVGYAQWQRGSVRTAGNLEIEKEKNKE
jgi:hypothetical protein